MVGAGKDRPKLNAGKSVKRTLDFDNVKDQSVNRNLKVKEEDHIYHLKH